jgi:drug/metabolite transporter (DMT)-like permease
MILVLLLYVLFASTFTLGKLALNYCQPIFFIAIRMLLGGFLLLGYEYAFNRAKFKLQRDDYYRYLKLILFHIFFAFNLEFWALQYVSGAKACLIYNLSPFITALYAYHILKERLHKQQIVGLMIGFAGFLPILLACAPSEELVGSLGNISFPELALLGAVISSAFGWIIFKDFMQKGYSFVLVNGIAMLGGGLLSLMASLCFEYRPYFKWPITQDWLSSWISHTFNFYNPVVFFLIYASLLILIANIICYNLYGYLLKKYSATFLSFAGFTCPLFAALYDWLFIGQLIGAPFIISFMIICMGLYIFYLYE